MLGNQRRDAVMKSEAAIRDHVTANGIREYQILQPYASNSANRLEYLHDREEHKELPSEYLTAGDAAFVKTLVKAI